MQVLAVRFMLSVSVAACTSALFFECQTLRSAEHMAFLQHDMTVLVSLRHTMHTGCSSHWMASRGRSSGVPSISRLRSMRRSLCAASLEPDAFCAADSRGGGGASGDGAGG